MERRRTARVAADHAEPGEIERPANGTVRTFQVVSTTTSQHVAGQVPNLTLTVTRDGVAFSPSQTPIENASNYSLPLTTHENDGTTMTIAGVSSTPGVTVIPTTWENTSTTQIALMIAAATDYAQDRLGMALMEQTILATFYDGERIILPRGPLIGIDSITDRTDAVVTDYELRNYGRTTEVILSGHAGYPVSIAYRAGHASAAQIPAAIRLAIMAHAGTLYENRESTSDKTVLPVPHSLDAFYRLKAAHAGVG